jgi:hypothetical protein
MARSSFLKVCCPRQTLTRRTSIITAAALFVVGLAYSNSAAAARRVAQAPERDESVLSDTDEADFDSAFIVGLGMWRTPALPRLLGDNERSTKVDIVNYRKESQAFAALIETRLFFPFYFLDLPLGLSILTSQALTESSALSFTISSNKGAIRPKHNLALNIGVRADYSVAGFRTESSLELIGNHIVYLGANITALGPAFRFRADSEKKFPVVNWMGARPLLGLELYGSPYLTVSNYDNRISTESSGEVRKFPVIVQLANSASGWMFGTQVEGGFTWGRRDKGREQSVLLIWSYTQYHFNKLLERVTTNGGAASDPQDAASVSQGAGSVSLLDANSIMNAVSIGFRSTFL